MFLNPPDLLGDVRIIVRHLFLAGLELFGKQSNGAGQLLLMIKKSKNGFEAISSEESIPDF